MPFLKPRLYTNVLLVSALLSCTVFSFAEAVSPAAKSAAIQYALRPRSARIHKKALGMALDQEREVRLAAEDQARLSNGGLSVLGKKEQTQFKDAVAAMLREQLLVTDTARSDIEADEGRAVVDRLEEAAAGNPRLALERFVSQDNTVMDAAATRSSKVSNVAEYSLQGQQQAKGAPGVEPQLPLLGSRGTVSEGAAEKARRGPSPRSDEEICRSQAEKSGDSAGVGVKERMEQCVQGLQVERQSAQIRKLEDVGFGMQARYR